ncbi:TIGR01244 family sulfur transferase [Altererythrobacter ishigakiensis]|uniref:Sulfide:quinone oxidoreductase n=1 Tax=Altererythrobacter ishigakiensis TaxID=476157 RepID=A0A562ULY7_9SPHN|nr:TIGR01244 family sulfur transferase [Altererythrobacter ishigakiensis]TWJ06633.1 sulfide:quinone oxidoreductase [Altererythrobacter ishigakiensis]
MDIRSAGPAFAVAPQIDPSDVVALKERGFVGLICNRPDGEEDGQPTVAEMREAAQAAGMAFHHIPVSGGEFPDGAIAAFRAVRRGTEGPLLAYCRTGTRSITLDTLANPDDTDPSERLLRAANAGYDLTKMSDKLV